MDFKDNIDRKSQLLDRSAEKRQNRALKRRSVKNLINSRLIFYIIMLTLFLALYKNPSLNTIIDLPDHGRNGEYNNDDPSSSIKEEWIKDIFNAGNDAGKALAIDNLDNIYVVGKEFNTTYNNYDIFIAKYNNSGDIFWKRIWGGFSDDFGNAICLDSFNNLYITGGTESYGNGSSDICVIKYTSYGTFIWNKTWGGTDWDLGYGIIADNFNDIVVTGYTEAYGNFGDIIVLKYDIAGNLLKNVSWGGVDTDSPNSLVVDSSNNIFVTGYTSSFGAEVSDLFLIKLNTTLGLNWTKTWGATLASAGNDLIIDSNNDILIVGNTQNYGAGANDFALWKYNNTGNRLWNITWGGSDHDCAYAVDIDSEGNIYAAGYTKSFGGSDKDACTVKFNASGVFQWYITAENSNDDCAYGLAIDSHDNAFISGENWNSGTGFDFFLEKYAQLPNHFALMSTAGDPDSDGSFSLWLSNSLDANNYSLYQSNETIVKINDNVTKVVNGNVNKTFNLFNLKEGDYYFIAIAYNKFGNTSSNCVKITVQYPPGNILLNENIQYPDTDGKVLLMWNTSVGSDFYSIYAHPEPFVLITNNGTLVQSNIHETSYQIENLINGEYYYAIVATNEAGNTTSNCIEVVIRRAPCLFNLSTDATTPDEDGTFNLIWTKSNFSICYLVYYSNAYIYGYYVGLTSLMLNFTPEFDWSTYRYKINGFEDGTYYFVVVAVNQYGNCCSICIHTDVKIPLEGEKSQNNNEKDDVLPITLPISLIAFFLLLGVLIVLVKARTKRKTRFSFSPKSKESVLKLNPKRKRNKKA